jgi:transposase
MAVVLKFFLSPVSLSHGTVSLAAMNHGTLKLEVVNINPLSPKLNPTCYLLALLAHDVLHVTRIRVK